MSFLSLSLFQLLFNSMNKRSCSSEYFFEPISKPPSPFQTGLRYLKFLGQIKRQHDTKYPLKSLNLERTSAFSTNYYAPLPPLSSHLAHRSIQVDDDIDDLSYKTAIQTNSSSFSVYEFGFILSSIVAFICLLIFNRYSSYPIHCLLHKKFWYPIDFSRGFQCENTSIEIHYFEIKSIVYEIQLEKHSKTSNCLNVNIFSCLPIDYFSVPKGQIIRRNDQFDRYCNQTQYQTRTLSIQPEQTKWNLKNRHHYPLDHCTYRTNINRTTCFQLKLIEQCDLQIPWIDYCLKYSKTHLTCQAYI